jgi:hypothetical protein
MGATEEFLHVKQFDKLYEECTAAGDCYANGQKSDIPAHVNNAFDEMIRILEERTGMNETNLIDDDNVEFLSDLSKRNYKMYRTEETQADEDGWRKRLFDDAAGAGTAADNAFFALQEEVEKFAKFYVRGARPNAIDEASSGYSDGVHLTRDERNRSDSAFGIVFSAGMLIIGIVLLLISLVGDRSELMMTGFVFIVFSALLVALRFIKK